MYATRLTMTVVLGRPVRGPDELSLPNALHRMKALRGPARMYNICVSTELPHGIRREIRGGL